MSLRRDNYRRALAVAVALAFAFGAMTLLALEGREVVVVRTQDADGGKRATRTWIADAEGAAWIEAANPERPFLHDLEREPALVLDRQGTPLRCRASIALNPGGHERIRDLLAAKYGWADCWIGVLADTRRSLAVRLDCAARD
jgi:hypothetical protein